MSRTAYRCKDYRPLLRKCEEHGCSVEHTGKSHLAVRTPSGLTVYASGSPSDVRALQNFRTQLRRAGVNV